MRSAGPTPGSTTSWCRVVAFVGTVSLGLASLVGVLGVTPAGASVGPPDHLAFTPQPGDGTAGSLLTAQPKVSVEDSSDNVVTTDTTTVVTLSLTTGPGTLTCPTSTLIVTVSAGVATFAGCTIDTAHTGDVLTATASGSPSVTASTVTSSPFNVSDTTATQLAFTTQPGNGVADRTLVRQPAVSLQDAAGRLVTTDTAPISLFITLGTGAAGAVLSCDRNTVDAVAGVASFSGCAIDEAATGYTLTALAGGPLTATSRAFDVSPATTPLPIRIFGADAVGTSIKVSQAAFPKSGSAAAVVLARSDFFSDALAGGPLAADVGGPLLITPGTPVSSSLDPQVLAEIERVLPTGKTVYLLGGMLALSSSIDATLADAGYPVQRVAGANEFDTAVAIADQLGDPSTIFEATGLNFPDALSAVPAAIQTGGAIVLTNGTTQAPETAAFLTEHPPSTRYVVGGPVAAYQDPAATPVWGADEFGTSAAVATQFFAKASSFGVATALNYPDALSGGVFMATGERLGPVLLVNPDLPLPPTIATYLGTLAVGTQGYVFGGPLAVAGDIDAAVQAAVG